MYTVLASSIYLIDFVLNCLLHGIFSSLFHFTWEDDTFTKQEDVIRDEESNILKQKNVLSKEVYAEKVKQLNQKINELKSKQVADAKKFESDFERSTNKIQGALVDVLSMIAGKKKLDLVLAKSQVLLVGKEIDITDQAIQELNKVLPKISLKK